MKTGIIKAAAIFLLLTSYGCGTSKITSSWKNERIPVPSFKKIMVLAITKDEERTARRDLENHMVGDLQEAGYDAVSAYQHYGPKAFEGLDETEALQQLREDGVEVVLTIVLLNKKKERYYTPGHIYYTPYGYYSNRFWPYHTMFYRRIYEPGYYIIDTKYFWESNLYDIRNQNLIYSVQTSSFDFSSSAELGHKYGKMIVRDMLRHGIIKTNNKKTDHYEHNM